MALRTEEIPHSNSIDYDQLKRNTQDLKMVKNIFMIENAAGIFRFNIRDEQVLHPTWINKLYATFLVVLTLTLFGIFVEGRSALKEDFVIIELMDISVYAMLMFQYVVTVLTTTIFFNKVYADIFSSVKDLDCKFSSNGIEVRMRSSGLINKLFVLILVGHVVISIFYEANKDPYDYKDFIFMPLFLVQQFEIIVFCYTIEILRSRLDSVNIGIQEFLDTKNDASALTVNEHDIVNALNTGHNTKIRELAIMYDTIGSICSMINNVFNFQIFMTLTSVLFNLTITVWAFLYFIRNYEQDYAAPLILGTWSALILMTVTTMCYICEKLISSRNTTKELVNEVIMDYDLPKPIRAHAKAFMELIESWPLRVVIYDMFSIDIHLVLKIISISTTYLIVIIQAGHF